MARKTFNVERGYAISAENGDVLVEILSGSGAPGNDSGPQDAAPIGSLWLRTDGTGGTYKKIGNANTTADWNEVGNVALDQLTWRNEKVIALTNATVVAANGVDYTVWLDNDDGFTPAVGQYVIGSGNLVPALFEITGVGAGTVDLVAASQPIASGDTFVIQHYLPDPTGQENQAIFHVPTAGAAGVKISDIDWAFLDAISLNSPYVGTTNGTPTAGDSGQVAIGKLDANQRDLITLSGESQGAVGHGTFTGVTIPDNSTTHAALQALETALEALEVEASVNVAAGTPTPVLPISVDGFNYIEYEVWCYEQADETKKEGFKFTILHDGTTVADATDNGIDNSVSNKHAINKIAGLTVDHVLSGTGGAQTVAMEISATAAITVKVRRTAVSA